MARRPRLDIAGFHHIVNRGVDRNSVFKSSEDKDKFLEILCKAAKEYYVDIHDYCLMDNHYHLLAFFNRNNLSLFMRQINSNWAIYFNKKYKRNGHLWQGRFKSWYVFDEKYLYTLFRYIEHNPIEAKISSKAGEYSYTLLHNILNKKSVIKCAKNSLLIKELKYLDALLQIELTKNDLEKIKELQRQKIDTEGSKVVFKKSKPLSKHFEGIKTKEERNLNIIEALKDGYTQSEIAKYLKLTPTAISKVKKKYVEK